MIRIRANHDEQPTQFDGFLWPVKGVTVPDDFITELKAAAYIDTPVVIIEWRKNNKAKWTPFADRWAEMEKVRSEGRVGGSSPAAGPPPDLTAHTLKEAAARGIYVGDANVMKNFTAYDTKGNVERQSHCDKCAGPLTPDAINTGETCHKPGQCTQPQHGTEQSRMMPPMEQP